MSWLGRRWLGTMMTLVLVVVMTTAAWAKRYALSLVVQGVKAKVSLAEDVMLTGKVGWRGPRAQLTYQWSSLDGPNLPYDADLSAKKLLIPHDELQVGESYRVQLRVTATYHDPDEDEERTTEAVTVVRFTVNAPPTAGTCAMEVSWIGANQASVTIVAAGFSDEDEPLQYRYTLTRNGKDRLVKNWVALSRHSIVTLARPGDTLRARCDVRDQLGDFVSELSDEVRRSERSSS